MPEQAKENQGDTADARVGRADDLDAADRVAESLRPAWESQPDGARSADVRGDAPETALDAMNDGWDDPAPGASTTVTPSSAEAGGTSPSPTPPASDESVNGHRAEPAGLPAATSPLNAHDGANATDRMNDEAVLSPSAPAIAAAEVAAPAPEPRAAGATAEADESLQPAVVQRPWEQAADDAAESMRPTWDLAASSQPGATCALDEPSEPTESAAEVSPKPYRAPQQTLVGIAAPERLPPPPRSESGPSGSREEGAGGPSSALAARAAPPPDSARDGALTGEPTPAAEPLAAPAAVAAPEADVASPPAAALAEPGAAPSDAPAAAAPDPVQPATGEDPDSHRAVITEAGLAAALGAIPRAAKANDATPAVASELEGPSSAASQTDLGFATAPNVASATAGSHDVSARGGTLVGPPIVVPSASKPDLRHATALAGTPAEVLAEPEVLGQPIRRSRPAPAGAAVPRQLERLTNVAPATASTAAADEDTPDFGRGRRKWLPYAVGLAALAAVAAFALSRGPGDETAADAVAQPARPAPKVESQSAPAAATETTTTTPSDPRPTDGASAESSEPTRGSSSSAENAAEDARGSTSRALASKQADEPPSSAARDSKRGSKAAAERADSSKGSSKPARSTSTRTLASKPARTTEKPQGAAPPRSSAGGIVRHTPF